MNTGDDSSSPFQVSAEFSDGRPLTGLEGDVDPAALDAVLLQELADLLAQEIPNQLVHAEPQSTAAKDLCLLIEMPSRRLHLALRRTGLDSVLWIVDDLDSVFRETGVRGM